MKAFQLMFACALLSVAAFVAVHAQGGGVQEGVKLGKVYVTGENPVIRLLDKENGTTLTNASYWRIIWSPVGPGHVLYVTMGDGKAPTDLRVALTDNEKLYEFLTKEITAVLDANLASRPFTSAQATFGDTGQGVFNDAGNTMRERK